MTAPRHLHLVAVKRIIRYFLGAPTRGLFFPVGNSLSLVGYSDSDWADCQDTRNRPQDQDPSKTSENKVEKSGKKTRRKQSSGAKSILELQTEDENVSCKNVNLAIDGTRELEMDASSILTKKNLAKTSTENQLNGSICKPGQIAWVETDPLHS
ncbi:hypothetical protein LWI29_038058 [Acer saccharum]|uniref:Mitochondrial protein n=1 Tax=Acer saccharum TaxID=4024 RepID=A0AA39TPG2_ACESA|nr:hypothetical protein LWI29_038058 [Acer saccharum]